MLSKEEFNMMWSELFKSQKVFDLNTSNRMAGIVKKYLYKAGKIKINTQNITVDENSGSVEISLERYDGDYGPVSVSFSTYDGTAVAGVDYQTNSGTIGWNDKEVGVKKILVKIIDDTEFEGNEVVNFSFRIFNPTNGATLGTNAITIGILDNDIVLPPTTERKLLGGWRVANEFARGAIAIDWATRKLYMVGHAQRNEVQEYDLPAEFGPGEDINAWPRLNPVKTHAGWWVDGYANGLCWWKGKLWAIVRKFYDMAPPSSLTLFAQDGEKIVINLPRQVFNGFVKFGPNQDPLIGCGGYESGQGSCSGPSLCTLDGLPLIQYGWPSSPGANLENWNLRAPREPNYSIAADGWVGWVPRVINGVLEGRWACDRVYGGGLALPEGICYWTVVGVGDLDYKRQNETFAPSTKVYKYIYDKDTYELLRWEECPGLNGIVGQEIDASGRLYLADRNCWNSGLYKVDPVIRVYG